MTKTTPTEQNNQPQEETYNTNQTQQEMREIVSQAYEKAPEYMGDFRETLKAFTS